MLCLAGELEERRHVVLARLAVHDEQLLIANLLLGPVRRRADHAAGDDGAVPLVVDDVPLPLEDRSDPLQPMLNGRFATLVEPAERYRVVAAFADFLDDDVHIAHVASVQLRAFVVTGLLAQGLSGEQHLRVLLDGFLDFLEREDADEVQLANDVVVRSPRGSPLVCPLHPVDVFYARDLVRVGENQRSRLSQQEIHEPVPVRAHGAAVQREVPVLLEDIRVHLEHVLVFANVFPPDREPAVDYFTGRAVAPKIAS
eukprot:31337-Pelagococcus_subviridis.AAC.1